jgi:hypothetical protein
LPGGIRGSKGGRRSRPVGKERKRDKEGDERGREASVGVEKKNGVRRKESDGRNRETTDGDGDVVVPGDGLGLPSGDTGRGGVEDKTRRERKDVRYQLKALHDAHKEKRKEGGDATNLPDSNAFLGSSPSSTKTYFL